MTIVSDEKPLRLEHIHCDLCGSDDYVVRYRKPDNWLWLHSFEYPVVECQNCRLVYVNPRPLFEDMGDFYPNGYHDGRDDVVHLQRYKNQFDYITKFNASTVLDIGCARGDWLNYIHQIWPNTELHGVDAFSKKLNNNNIIFYNTQLHKAELPKSYFDVITSWAVIEHVHTPDAYFKSVSELLKPNGKFIFLVTNAESIYGKFAYKEDIPRHLYHFSKESLSRYAQKHSLILDDISFDERFWDGSGKGVFYFTMAKIIGYTWRDIKINKPTLIVRALLKLSSILDNIVFFYKWEKHIRKSGIIVVTMSKSS